MDYLEHHKPLLRSVAPWLAISAIPLAMLYYYLLPKPLPDIPYDRKSARSIMGDIPKMLKHYKTNKEALTFFGLQCQELNSPLIQLMISLFDPLQRTPVLVLSDMREMEDILSRRSKEFDRMNIGGQILSNVLGESTITMPSHDRFKAQRKLWAGTMMPEFLHRIASLYLHDTAATLVQLWKRKAELAQGRPFDALEDLRSEGFDAIWAFAVGQQLGSTRAQLQHLHDMDSSDITVPENNAPVLFPKGKMPELYEAIMYIINTMDSLNGSVFPKLTWFFISLKPSFTRQLAKREKYMDQLIADARASFADKQSSTADETVATSAMDQVLRRLHNSKIHTLNPNTKEPDRHLKDELFLLLLAGYETTATTLAWAVKFLAAHPDTQSTLRKSLQSVFGATQSPSAPDILSANLPHLDAFIAETFRCSMISGGHARQATCDTSILGYPVPKGAIVIMSNNGPTYLFDRHLPSPERRSESSKQYAGARGQNYSWPLEGRREFRPERWLRLSTTTKDNEEVEEVIYDEHAGPQFPFGLGPRGCFGKRLALMKLRITLVLLVLGLEFLEVEGTGKDEKGEVFELAGWEAREKLARMPRSTFVRVRGL